MCTINRNVAHCEKMCRFKKKILEKDNLFAISNVISQYFIGILNHRKIQYHIMA